jgi:hypothetical protein
MGIRGSFLRSAKRCVLAIAALLHATAAYADDFSILYHERPGAWIVPPDETSKSSTVQSAKPADDSVLSFTAFGRVFRARLERNDLLLRGLSSDARSSLSGIEVFRGDLVDVQSSWVRFTRARNEISGAIFDGVELFAIDSAIRLRPHLKLAEPLPYTGPIVYRWRDTTGTLTDELRGSVRTGSTEAPSAYAAAAGVLDPGRRLDLGLVADGEYSYKTGSAGAAGEALRSANLLDGILVFELGLHVNVAELAVFTQEADPFTTSDPGALLDELAEYRATTAAQSVQDLTHLLTGRNFDGIIGIANLGTVCDARLGVSITESMPGTLRDALIMAHEIGHNLGAPHDNVAGPCLSTPPAYLMAPSFNSSQEYSACSIEQMQPKLTSACLDVLAPADVELRTLNAPTDTVVSETFQIKVALDNPSSADAHGVEVLVDGTNMTFSSLSNTATDGFSCTIVTPSSARFPKRVLASGESVVLEINARMVSAAPATVSIVLRSLSDPDTTDNTATYTIAVRPIVNLAVEFAPAPDLVRAGQTLDYSVTVRNDGTMTATNARALVTLPWHILNALNLSTGVGTCVLESDRYVCPLGSLAPGETRQLSLNLRAVDSVSPALTSVAYVQGSVIVEAVADQPNYISSWRNKLITVAESVTELQATGPRGLQFVVGTPVEFTINLANAGPDVATELVFVLNQSGFAEQGLTDAEITSNLGTCRMFNRSALWGDCRVPTLAVGEQLAVTIRATASRLGLFQVSTRTELRAYDPQPDNNDVRTSYSVVTASVAQPPVPVPPPSTTPPSTAPPATSGGGGGAADPIWLAVLAFALALRIARYRAARGARLADETHVERRARARLTPGNTAK